jgi:GH25 family lysozyme M1 (1,4-beta-N-acetylmuramidase)
MDGLAHVAYQRTYVLFHASTPLDWLVATRTRTLEALDASGNRLYTLTFGFSADDAGVGAYRAPSGAIQTLPRTIIAPNQALWGADPHPKGFGLRGYLNSFYPGAELYLFDASSAEDCARRVLDFLEGKQPVPSGVDVSRWQGTIDWGKMVQRGVNFAWIKATESTALVDPQFARNWVEARNWGILRGAYAFYRNNADPQAQADHLASVLGEDVGELPPAGDFEDTSGQARQGAMHQFLQRIQVRTGVRPVVYTAAWWWTARRLGGPVPWAKDYALWVADYNEPLALPGDWTTWAVHQWTSSGDGRAHGAQSVGLDLNRFNGSFRELWDLKG